MEVSNHKRVVNLSDFSLKEHHITLLNRGLKFCPTPNAPNPGELREDMDRIHKRLRQIAFFHDDDGDESSVQPSQAAYIAPPEEPGANLLSRSPFKHRKFKLPSTGKGPIGPQNLESFIAANQKDFDNRPVFKTHFRSNLSPQERKALEELKSRDDIIIRIADKGAAVVLLNRSDYLSECYRQLTDTKYYSKLDHNPTDLYRLDVLNQVEDMYQNGEIDITVKEYLQDCKCRTPEFYTIPKIHKIPLKGRPIVSGNEGPTEKISQFVDHFLNPPTTKIRSYVKDTTHLLQILNQLGSVPPHTLLATLDVASLYTNINNEEGLKAAKSTLEKSRPEAHIKPSNLSLLKLLELVLTRTNFQFNGQNFLQISGTCMGTKVAPSYAINTLGHFEDQFVHTYPLKCLVYLRYIDDILILWTHSRDQLETFVQHLNGATSNFTFTHEISTDSVTFLDTQISLQNNHIVTDLYCKPTDSHNYLVYESAHPQRCKDSIPFSQFLRIRRICSNVTDFDRHVVNFCGYFLKRNYPTELLKEAAILARSKNRSELLQQKDKVNDDQDRVFLITTYHPHDRSLVDIFHTNWSILGRSLTTEFLFKKKLMCGYRRPKNLRDLLVRAKVPHKPGDELCDPTHLPLPTSRETTPTPVGTVQKSITDFFKPGTSTSTGSLTDTFPIGPVIKTRLGTDPSKRGHPFCNHVLCRYCPLLNKTGRILCSNTQIEHTCMTNISCRSSNLIYAITCKRCNKQYVGQTSLRLKDRFVHHFRDIEVHNKEKSIGRHFSTSDHSGFKDLQISVLEFIRAPPRSPQASTIRNRVERHWTHLLRTLAPAGLNMENPKELISKK